MKLTNAQAFVFHTLLSVLMGALFAGVTVLLQAIGSNGAIDMRVAVSAGVAAFLAWFGKGLVSLESSPQTAQAMIDTLKGLQASHSTLVQQVSNLGGIVTSLLHITNAAQAPAQPAQPVQLTTAPQNSNATNALPPAPPFVSVLTSGANSPAPQFVSIPPGQSTLPTATQQAALDRGWSAMLPSVPPPQQQQ